MTGLNKNIRYYLLAGSVSRFGDVLSGMAFLFLAYDMTQSALHTTVIAAGETIPYLFNGLIGGVAADWLPKKKLLLFLDLVRIPLISSVVIFYQLELLNFIYLMVISFLIHSIGCFFNPAHRAILPLITKESERTKVNSLYDSLTRGVTVLSPFLSVWLLNSYGVIHFFTIDAVSYAVSALSIWRIHFKNYSNYADRSLKAMFGAITEFLSWAKNHTMIKQLFFFTFLTVFFNTWVWEVGLLLALKEITGSSEEIYSILQGVFGAAVILTNLMIPYLIKKMSLTIYLAGSLIWGSGVVYYGLTYNVVHFFIGCVIVGIGLPIAGLARVYLLQTLVPENKMGRAFSTNAVLLYLANTLSLALYGSLAIFVPIQFLIIFSGVMIVSLIGIGLRTVIAAKLGRCLSINFFK
ncbi:MFS transporter [Halobacillus massiliensis]|uniref:MFS transporter n=1 Tax=Halobacillus massiliensis TaxID=1926286 RepID=UPI0009E487E5|nr:MFS transporter [Halobacillus massiliensis]